MKLCPHCDTGYPDSQTICPTHGGVLSEIRDLRPGMLIRNTYRIVRKLGQGGMGAVYLAQHTLMNEPQALKFLSSELSRDEAFTDRFLREVRTLRQVRHKNVVDAGNPEPAEDGTLFFPMEFVDGPDLRSFLRNAPQPFDVPLALAITRGIAEGLGAAHAKGMVHRDIKPENILMARNGNQWVPKIVDFGIVATRELSQHTQTGSLLLTPFYAAPEQWLGTRASELDGRTDFYALGGVFFEILTGQKVFEAANYPGWAQQHMNAVPRTPSTLRPDLANWRGLDAFVLRLLAKEREHRPKDVADLLALLDSIAYVPPPPLESISDPGIPVTAGPQGGEDAARRAPVPTLRQIGRYQLLDVIGQGGMGIVYRAVDSSMDRIVAIKMLHGAYAEDKDLLARFHREVRSTANLQHKNIVTVFTLDDFQGFPYMVMEYLEGSSMAEMIASHKPLHTVDKIGLLCQVCEGLQYAHERKVIHRDIKPGNVLILKDGVAKIVDFGIARVGQSENLTRTGQIIGSIYYMSPEQIGSGPVDGRSDIYSAGVTLYQFLTGEYPFKGEDTAGTFFKILNEPVPSIRQLLPDAPEALDAILAKSMAKKVEDRYQTAEEFGYDLSRLQEKMKQGMLDEFLSQAESAIERKEWDLARQQLQEVLKLDRRNTRANELFQIVREEMQRQQRSAQIEQLRMQAQVALAGRQFEEALECVDQARRLDPDDADLKALFQSIKEEVDREREIVEALRRGQAAFYAGDLNDAKRAVGKVLEIQTGHTEALALDTLIQKELAERTRRAKLQDFVEEARREISGRNFIAALKALKEAQAIDPSDSNIRELITWASRGYEQEKTKNELQEVTNEIGKLLGQDSYAAALQACEAAFQRFPQEPSLVKLQQLAKRQFDLSERRRAVDELCAGARRLADSGQQEEALSFLEDAVKSFPGDPNLETLLAMTRVECEQKRQEQEERESQSRILLDEQLAAGTATSARDHLRALIRSFHDGLAGKHSISQLRSLADRITAMVKDSPLNAEESAQLAAATSEFEARYAEWKQGCEELETLLKSLEDAQGSASVQPLLDRARSVLEQYGKDEEIRERYKKIRVFAEEFNLRREAAVTQVSGLVHSMQGKQDLPSLAEMEKNVREVSAFWIEDPFIRGLVDQAVACTEEALQQKQKLLQELTQIAKAILTARSAGGITLQLSHAQMLVSDRSDDADVAAEINRIDGVARDLLRQLETSSSQIESFTENITAATALDDIEVSSQKAHQVPAQLANFEEIADLLHKLDRRVEGRRKDHERVQKTVASLTASAANARRVAELDSILMRSRELAKGWQGDAPIEEANRQLEKVIEDKKAELAQLATSIEADEQFANDYPDETANLNPPAQGDLSSQARQQPASVWKSRLVPIALVSVLSVIVIALVSMRLISGTVQIDSPGGASIFVDGKQCAAPCREKLAPGQHIVLAQLAGYHDLREAFAVSSFETKIVTLNMTKAEGQFKPDELKQNAERKALPPGSNPSNNQLTEPGKIAGSGNATGVGATATNAAAPSPIAGAQQGAQPGSPVPNANPGGTTAVNPAPVPVAPAPMIAFNAAQQTIQKGQAAQLNWLTQNATDVRIDGGSVNPSGSMQVTPQQSTTYTLTAKGPGGAVTQSLHVDVQAPPTPSINSDQAAIQTALNQYRQGYESESLEDMKRVWPRMSKTEEKNMKGVFDYFNAIRLSLNCPEESIKVQGGAATANCQETFTYTLKGKKQPLQSAKGVFTLKKQGESWIIDDVR